jgi:two-component system OmpR family sensor kinase
MTFSLRSRLWWSYVLVTGAALGVVAMVLFIYIVKNPSTYRQASTRLTIVATLLRNSEADWTNLSPADLRTRLDQIDIIYGTRVAIYSTQRHLVFDSQSAAQPALQMPRFPRLQPYSTLRDLNGGNWLYMLRRLNDSRWLLVAIQRPAVPLLTILSDELMIPVFGAAIVALIISLLVAFWLARWIGGPLQQVVVASRKMPAAEAKPIVPQGPYEVRELARAFNAMNTRVQTSQKSQREFVANVSHELKTPLTSVQGFAQAILDGTANTPEAQKQAAQVIYDESSRMHRMVLDLLDLARLDAGTIDLERTTVDLTALLNSIAEKFAPQARAANVTITVEATALPVITGDGDRLAQVFSNLVDNALKFTPASGRITLRATQTVAGVQVEVTDTGTGIPTGALAQIFDRFYQADLSRPGGEHHGAGLGLAIVKEIVGAHGGKISVHSVPGAGSTFTITLPLTAPEASTVVSMRKK